MSSAALRAIQAHLRDFEIDPPAGINAGPEDDDLMVWTACVQGPPDTPYEGGLFFLSVKFGDGYPWDPPHVRFTTEVYHPNVNEKGDICLSILFKECSWDNGWSPAMNISSVLLSIVVLLQEPNTDHSLRPALAKQYLEDREAFNKAARAHTKKHAM